LDLIILSRYADFLITSDLQFGFKAKRSTNMCTMVLKEAIDYYTSNSSSDVFCSLLDTTKAFDRVDYCKLFRSLMNRDLPPIVLRLLLNMYTSQLTRVSWNGVFSSPFTVSNGVKQGGILSPIIFCIYIDSLLYSLAESGVGCFIGRFLLVPSCMRMILYCCPLQLVVCGRFCICVTRLPTIFQSFLMLLKLSACGSKRGKILLHIIRTPSLSD